MTIANGWSLIGTMVLPELTKIARTHFNPVQATKNTKNNKIPLCPLRSPRGIERHQSTVEPSAAAGYQ